MSTDTPDYSDSPYDYPPEFTQEEEQAARDEGFFDAYDRWRWIMGGKFADDSRERIKAQTKAQGIVDLGGVGLTSADLGALSDESLHLPLDPDYRAEVGEVRAQGQPYLRHAQFVGACNRLVRIHERLDRYDLTLDADSSDLWGDRLSALHWAHIERGKVATTLDALGEDIEEVEARIEAGDIQFQDFIESPRIISADPDVQQVEEAYREELRLAGIETEDDEDLTVDLRKTRGTQSKVPRLIASQEGGPAQYDDRPSEELQSRVPHSPIVHSQGAHVKDHEYGLMKERIGQLDDLLRDMGYTRDTDMANVAPTDWDAFREIQSERYRISGDLAELTENISDVEQELDQDRTVFEEQAEYEYFEDGDSGDRTADTSYESMDIEMSDEGGDAMDMDGFEAGMDGFDGMEDW
jgi:hypothetical protein